MKRSISTVSSVLVMTSVVLMLLSTALPAFAQEINPCEKDFKQYCADVTPGGGRLVRCYEERKEKMSPECRAWADNVKSNAAFLQKACSKEMDARCNFEKGDPFEMLDCLQGNYIDLSPECTAALNKFKARYPKPVK